MNYFNFKKAKALLLALTLIAIAFPHTVLAGSLPTPPSPTILYPTNTTKTPDISPLIKGVTKNNTRVAVYIDGVYNGDAKVSDHPSGTASFAYKPFLNLKPGVHTVSAVAHYNKHKTRSPESKKFYFEVTHPYKTQAKKSNYPLYNLPAPTILNPTQDSLQIEAKPLIKGVTKNNTRVAVYIDGVYNGDAKISDHPSGTASFAYKPFLNLKPGVHTVSAKAVSLTIGLSSPLSKVKTFNVSTPHITPTILSPINNTETTATKPMIIGVAKNNSTLKVFINNELNGVFKVTNHPSGTASFAYKPFLNLKPGVHTVSIIAVDSSGKPSMPTKTINIRITASANSEIAATINSNEDGGEVKGEELIPTTNSNEKNTDDLVNEQTEESAEKKWIGYLILGAVILILMVNYFWSRRREQKDTESQKDFQEKSPENSDKTDDDIKTI